LGSRCFLRLQQAVISAEGLCHLLTWIFWLITSCLSFVPNFYGRIQGAAATLGGATGFSAILFEGWIKKKPTHD